MTDEQTIGKYRILERIGRGGMGVVYKGVDSALERDVAIKVMSNAVEADDGARTRFFREARAAARLQHRNIVTIYEFDEEDGVPYIVMEHLRGQSLAARISEGPPLTIEESLDVVAELCAGLQFAHEHGVIHRDVKPANVWLLKDGSVKLLDFGIAKVSSSTLTTTGDVMGSASYMSPEQVAGKTVDGRADVFSAAVVLYELLAGRTPFQAESPTATILKIAQEDPAPIESLVSGIPPALGAALKQALQKDPNNRYHSAGDFGDDLQLVRMALPPADASGDAADVALIGTRLRPLAGVDRTDLPLDAGRTPVPADPTLHRGESAGRRGLVMAGVAAALVLIASLGWVRMKHAGDVVGDTAPQPPVQTQERSTQAPQEVPPQPPPARRVKITSTPDGAAIDIDGKSTDQVTPADVALDGELPVRIRLTKKGFQPFESRLTAAVAEQGPVSYRLVALEPVTVKLTATGSYPFEISDGKRVVSERSTTHELSVPAGTFRLQAAAHLLDSPFKVDAAGGKTMQIRAPELGGLTIRSSMETCQVIVNGHDLGFPPVNGQSVAAGTYDVQLNCPDGQRLRSAVTVVPGQTRIARIP